ncbi:hypothetical protein ASE76_03535 [Xylophilus sp. Leaf220]|nr:hypothetical protein ASE76_03535 [Xylophilus sp. Leaf220]
MPCNTSGFGTVLPAAQAFERTEIRPLQARFCELNEWAGRLVVRFAPYKVLTEKGNSEGA